MTDRSSPVGSRPQLGSGALRARRRHPLLDAFPLAVMTLTTFLVVFTILMARLQSGADPALRAAASRSLVSPGSGPGMVITRTSGAGGASVGTSGASEEGTRPVLTRTSGSGAGGESDGA